MIGLPFFADQIYNCKRIEYKKLGICMDLRYLTVEPLLRNINKILYSDVYTAKAQKASKIFRDRTLNPRETAAYWVDHVLKFGGEHLRSIIMDMPWYKYYMVDILLVVMVTILVVFFVLKWCVKLLVRILKGQSYYKMKTH